MWAQARPYLINAAIGIVSFAGGFFVQDFTAFRSDYRAEQRSVVEQSNEVGRDLDKVLTTFASIAAGQAAKSNSDIEALRDVLLRDQDKARQLARLVGTPPENMKPFEGAAVRLLGEAEKLKGPLEAARMTEAVSTYLYTRQQFHNAVSESRSGYLF